MSFAQLAERLKTASQQYYSNGSSPMSDAEFDAGLKILAEADPNNNVVRSVGHGYDLTKVPGQIKRPHVYGLVGSLPKCHNVDELPNTFHAMPKYDVSIKLDGISCVLYYTEGELEYALTRGDGTLGIDITHVVEHIPSVPKTIADKTCGIRGEIVMRNDNFDRYKLTHPDVKNSRNTVAGIVSRTRSVDFADYQYLEFVAYRVIGQAGTASDSQFHSHLEMLQFLERSKFAVVPYTVYQCPLSSKLVSMMHECRNGYIADGEVYPWDGLVITDDYVSIDLSAGYNFHSIAFKFPAEEKVAEVVDVEWNISKQQSLIPRIRVKPVNLSGTTVTACAGFNAQYIQENAIGPGALVSLCKSGEIIPDIQKVIKPGQLTLPTHCPVCNSRTTFEGVHLVCKNPNCDNIAYQDTKCWLEFIAPIANFDTARKLSYLHERLGVNFTIETLMDTGASKLLSDVNDSALDRMYLDFLDSLFLNSVPADRALQALNIPRLGDVCSKKLAKYEAVVDSLIAGVMPANLAQLIGSANAAAIDSNIAKFKRLNYIRNRIVFPKTAHHQVAVTGKLSVSRKQFEAELAKLGYEVTSLTRRCEYLITDDPNSGSSKNLQADKYNIPKVTESEFRALINL